MRKIRKARPGTARKIALAVECFDAGMSSVQTAKKLGMSVQSLYVWRSTMRRRGIEIPLFQPRVQREPTPVLAPKFDPFCIDVRA